MTTFDRIVIDACMMGGKPCIKGSRLTIDTIVGIYTTQNDMTRLIELYPELTPEDVSQAMAYSTWRKREQTLTLSL